jgi:hypothetical protein
MRVSPVAVFALATLAVNHATQPADAEPTPSKLNARRAAIDRQDVRLSWFHLSSVNAVCNP